MYTVALIGGLEHLRNKYIDTAKSFGVDLKFFEGRENCIRHRFGELDMMIVFTDNVSHSARQEVVKHARLNIIPLRLRHSSSISTLRKCFAERA
ncbi:MAG: DUF2325 domain-containing protein [Candidatus Adiutrix sp.]|jgi:hypothetical protein|nr:DUF2325 domain-containing protein [Candidatus Adiutrix sp.]